MNVVIVGKGSSLLKKDLGSTIDEFDEVIRVNHIPTPQLQKHVGIKTTIFSSRVPSKIQKFLDYIKSIGRLWVCDSTSDVVLSILHGTNIDVEFLTSGDIDELIPHFIGYGNSVKPNDSRFDVCVPDTGITTIFSTIKRFPGCRICVCGIDLYTNGNKNIIKDDDISSIFKMPVLLQTLYYKKLVHAGKIKEL